MDNQIKLSNTSDNFRFSASVAELGMLLRDSEFKAKSTYGSVLNLAYGAKGDDIEGYRTEFIQLAEACKMLSENGKYSQR